MDSDDVEAFPVDRYLRAVRRQADLSQRQLAARAGVEPYVVGRAESRPDLARATVLAKLLRAVDHELLIAGPHGLLLDPAPHDERRDQARRRYPAHLDVRDGDDDWWGTWWVWSGFFKGYPRYTFDLSRGTRDWRRRYG